MNILFISPDINPFTATQGSSQRTNLLLHACARTADVDVISFCTNDEVGESKYSILFQKYVPMNADEGRLSKFIRLLTPWKIDSMFPKSQLWESIIDKAIAKKEYDYIVIRYIPMAISCGLMKYSDKLIIDVDDSPVDRAYIESKIARSFRNRLYHTILSKVLRITMDKIAKRIYHSFFSNAEQAIYSNSSFLPNIPYYKERKESKIDDRHQLLFIGDLWYKPNQDGLEFFLNHVYPFVRKQIPDLTMHVVGRNAEDDQVQRWEKIDGVSVMGFVPDISEEYSHSMISVIPIYYGAGTCIKVLESIQMKTVCVTTPTGFRGYGSTFIPGEDCLLAENSTDFANKIVMAIRDENLRIRMVKSAYRKLSLNYSRERFNEIVSTVIK